MNEKDNFKPLFKYYKQRAAKPSLRNVIDVNKCLNNSVSSSLCDVSLKDNTLGLKQIDQWEIHCCNEIPGLYFILNPFTDEGADTWVRHCLEDYCCPPHKTNLPSESNSIWTDTCAHLQNCSVENFNKNVGEFYQQLLNCNANRSVYRGALCQAPSPF